MENGTIVKIKSSGKTAWIGSIRDEGTTKSVILNDFQNNQIWNGSTACFDHSQVRELTQLEKVQFTLEEMDREIEDYLEYCSNFDALNYMRMGIERSLDCMNGFSAATDGSEGAKIMYLIREWSIKAFYKIKHLNEK